jgi:hypothetical protein
MADAPLSVWVTVGEFNETIQTIVWSFQKIRTLIDLLHKTRGPKARAELVRRWKKRGRRGLNWSDFRELSDTYLQVRYGIRPLIYDVLGALKVLRTLGDETRQRFGHGSDVVSLKSTSVDYTQKIGTKTYQPVLSCNLSKSHEYVVRAGLLANPVFEEANLLTLIGTGETVKAMWDLVPYSFVIDWFLTTQEFLTAWSPNAFVQVLASWAVYEETQTVTTKVLPGGHCWPTTLDTAPQISGELSTSQGQVQYFQKWKYRIPDPPRATIPSFRIKLDVLKGLDLVALARQFGKFRHGF